MKIFSEVIGNMTTDPQWAEKLKNTKIEYLELDQHQPGFRIHFTKDDLPVSLQNRLIVSAGSSPKSDQGRYSITVNGLTESRTGILFKRLSIVYDPFECSRFQPIRKRKRSHRYWSSN